MDRMRKKTGLTLIELQVSSLLLMVILVVSGVIFYFALSSMAHLNDAFGVYKNAHAAMKFITMEVMRSNRYGWSQGPAWVPPVASFYAEVSALGGSSEALPFLPTLGANNTSSVLVLQQDAATGSGAALAVPTAGNYADDEYTIIGLDPLDPETLYWDRNVAGFVFPLGAVPAQKIAEGISSLIFTKVAFNCLNVQLTVHGKMLDSLGGYCNQINLSSLVTLRCAPAVTCEPWDTGDW